MKDVYQKIGEVVAEMLHIYKGEKLTVNITPHKEFAEFVLKEFVMMRSSKGVERLLDSTYVFGFLDIKYKETSTIIEELCNYFGN